MADYTAPTAADLALFLAADSIDEARATLYLTMATNLAVSVVSPLPSGAEAVVLSAAARAFVNPSQTTYQTVGSFSMQQTFPGVYLTKNERRALRSLAGRKGAFTVDPTPVDAMASYVDPLAHPTTAESADWSLNHPRGL